MRLVTYDAGLGAQAGVLVGEEIVPCSALDAPAGKQVPCRGEEVRARTCLAALNSPASVSDAVALQGGESSIIREDHILNVASTLNHDSFSASFLVLGEDRAEEAR